MRSHLHSTALLSFRALYRVSGVTCDVVQQSPRSHSVQSFKPACHREKSILEGDLSALCLNKQISAPFQSSSDWLEKEQHAGHRLTVHRHFKKTWLKCPFAFKPHTPLFDKHFVKIKLRRWLCPLLVMERYTSHVAVEGIQVQGIETRKALFLRRISVYGATLKLV